MSKENPAPQVWTDVWKVGADIKDVNNKKMQEGEKNKACKRRGKLEQDAQRVWRRLDGKDMSWRCG